MYRYELVGAKINARFFLRVRVQPAKGYSNFRGERTNVGYTTGAGIDLSEPWDPGRGGQEKKWKMPATL